MISLTGIRKRFAGVTALDDVSLEFQAGQVHGLLGENGAGKSTLMNVLVGLIQPDAGGIAIQGKSARITSPLVARRCGIGMVHQHFKLVPTLSVADNVALALGTSWRLDRADWCARIVARAQRLAWQIDPLALVEDLGVGQQQRVEILKALLAIDLVAGARTLILDEPTAVLTPQEIDDFLPAVRALAAEGVVVIYISHKLQEIARVCDVVSVLRRGRLVHQGPASTPPERLAELMVGAATPRPLRTPTPASEAQPVRLSTRDLTIAADGRTLLDHVTVSVRAGEIVGIAGVEGNGQGALVQALLGLRSPTQGTVQTHDGRVAVIPDDRQRDALVMPFSVTQNLLLRSYRSAPFSRHGWLFPHAWRERACALMAAGDIRAVSADVAVATLSGGNQQKAVVARELADEPAVVLAINPTRGLDVGAAAAVLERLLAARDRGAAVLLIHSDLDEVLAISDRVLVMQGGRLHDSEWPSCDRQHIGRLMVGLT